MAFARTKEFEVLFARGYPHLRRLVTPHPHEADAEARAERALDDSDPITYHVDWPAEVAYRFVRALANVGPHGIGFSAARAAGHVKAADQAIKRGGPVDEKEGRALVAKLLGPEHSHYEFQVEHGVLLLEAMIGGAALVDAVLGGFERLPKLDSKYSTRDGVAYNLGFVIRRLDAKPRAAAEARVKKLVATKPEGFTRDFLSYLVGGRAALEASGRALGLYCVHFCDDPALVRALAKDGCDIVDANHVYLGGDPVLAAIARDLRKIDAHRQAWLIDELAPIASKKVEPILKALAAKKVLAARAQAALDQRAGKAPKAAPVEAAKAAKRPSDAAIEQRFEELSRWLATELAGVRGKKAKEKKALDEATLRYADLCNDLGRPPTEALVHFFGADGCGWKKHRTPALQRLDPTDAELTRWTDHLGARA